MATQCAYIKQSLLRVALRFVCVGCILLYNTDTYANTASLQLPTLGDTSAGLISTTEEYEFGAKLIRKYRAGLPESSDPFIEAYLDKLLRMLVRYSELSNPHLEILVIADASLNAFAAPGGIVGVNTGTFLVAQNEQQLSSILAHELAHLSQRHYARKIHQSKQNTFITLAAMLAGLVVLANSNSDSGMAVLPAIQAASIQSSLKFSRDMEQEADRIGMQTLLKAGLDPYGMPEMFEVMLRATRFRTKVPEFLLSHPVTESRISDSMGRASRYPKRQRPSDIDFQVIKARVIVDSERNAHVAVKRFRDEVNGNTLTPLAAQYGLVLALTQAGNVDEARKELSTLAPMLPRDIVMNIAQADIEVAAGNLDKAIGLLTSLLKRHPSSHPLNIRLAELLMKAGKYSLCESLLSKHVKRQPQNSYVWYLLAEVHGLAGHILEVHKARAEYFMLLGIYKKAEIQLKNALKLIPKAKFQDRAKIEQRLRQAKYLRENDLK